MYNISYTFNNTNDQAIIIIKTCIINTIRVPIDNIR